MNTVELKSRWLQDKFRIIFPRKILFHLFLLGLAFRLGFVVFFVENREFLPIPDQIIHHNLAINFNKGKGLTFPESLLEAPADSPQWVKNKFKKWKELGGFWGVVPIDKPQTSFPPLHPLYLSLVYKVFGPNPIASRIIQALLSAVTSIILYHLARRLLGENVALISYLIVIFYPYYIYYTGVLLSETISIFLLSLSLLLFALSRRSQKNLYPLACGFTLGLLFLSRSVFLLFFPLVIFTVLLTFKKRMRVVCFMTLAFLITLIPWLVRNYSIYGQFILLPTKGGWNLWERNNYRLNPEFLEVEHPELKEDFKIITEEDKANLKHRELTLYPNLKGKTEPERDKIFKRMFIEFVKANPVIYLKLCYIRLFEFFRVTHKYIEGGIYKTSAWLSIGLMLILGFVGGLLLFKRWQGLMILYLLLGYYIPLHVLTTSGPRYRLMIEFIFIFFSAHLLYQLFLRIFSDVKPIRKDPN